MQSIKDEDKLLRSVTLWRKHHAKEMDRLGEKSQAFLQKNNKRFEKNSQIIYALAGLLPDNLLGHCKVFDIAGKTLRLQVDPGPYMFELRLASSELIEHLRKKSPRCGINRISLLVRTCFRDIGEVMDAWGRLLPDKYLNICRIDEIVGNEVTVVFRSWEERKKFKFVGDRLAKQLEIECPNCGINKISFKVIGPVFRPK